MNESLGLKILQVIFSQDIYGVYFSSHFYFSHCNGPCGVFFFVSLLQNKEFMKCCLSCGF